MNKPLTYIATPYSHGDPQIVQERYEKVTVLSGKLMAQGITVFSPISHCHPIAKEVELPTNWEFWKKIDRDFLSVSNCIIVACLEGWRESEGVMAELEIAKEFNIPIIYLFEREIEEVPEDLLLTIKEIIAGVL